MVVSQVLLEHSLEVSPIEDDHVIQTLSPNRSDHLLDIRVLPWRSFCCPNLLDAHRRQSTSEIKAIDLVVITDDIRRCSLPWERLGDLLARPCCSRVRRDVEVDDLPPRIVEDQEDVEDLEGRGWHRHTKTPKRAQHPEN